MRKPGLIGFCVTTAVLVPAALYHLDAGPTQRARLFAQKARSITMGTTHVDASIDQTFANAGDTVHLKLTADQATTVAVVTVGTTGNEQQRVENPPKKIGRQDVTLQPGVAMEVPVMLFGAHGDRGHANLGHYTSYVMSPADADTFEKWRVAKSWNARKRVKNGANPQLENLFESIESAWSPVEGVQFHGTSIAAFDAYTRAETHGNLTIKAPDKVTAGKEFTATVQVRNRSKEAVAMTVELTSPWIDDRSTPEDVKIERTSDDTVRLAPGETRTISYTVTAPASKMLALGAHAQCIDDDVACGKLTKDWDGGAFEAVQIVAEKVAAKSR